MSLILYLHPLSSYCQKTLIALYENDTPFEGKLLDLVSDEGRAEYLKLWPIGKMPVLRDETRDRTIPETSIIIEYLQRFYPGRTMFVPDDTEQALHVRLWDRFFDLYVSDPMQKLVGDILRPAGQKDPAGVANAKGTARYRLRGDREGGRNETLGLRRRLQHGRLRGFAL